MSFFYRPEVGAAADFIPFYREGDYHVFYLQDYRDREKYGEGTPWFHLVTKDFVNFENLGEAIPRGTADEQDLYVFTGSVFENEGRFYIFYTGHNGYYAPTEKPQQAVLRASSDDMKTWTKDRDFYFKAPAEMGYEKDDWRDPFVFKNPDTGQFNMVLAARKTSGPSRNRGCMALAVSDDLDNWEVRDHIWDPDLYFTHECPDVFKMGDWWYMVYSTFTERFVTHYRMSRSLSGPWLAPANDAFDARAYYAAKTAGFGGERYIFGWLPSRDGNTDSGAWEWGGNLVVHKVEQQGDGSLTVRMLDSVNAEFRKSADIGENESVLGKWDAEGCDYSTDAVGRHSIIRIGKLPDECLIECDVDFAEGTYGCGLLLRADNELDKYYVVRLEPSNNRIVMDRWPRPPDQSVQAERPLALAAGRKVKLRAIVDGSCLVVYADDVVAMCYRMYDFPEGDLCLFATEGKVTFTNLTIKTR